MSDPPNSTRTGAEPSAAPSGADSPAEAAADDPYRPRKLTSMASGSISLDDVRQVLTEEAKRAHLEATHSPWEQPAANPSEAARPPPLLLLSSLFALVLAALVFLGMRRGRADGPAAEPQAPNGSPAATSHLPLAELRATVEAAVKTLCESTDPEAILAVARDPEHIAAQLRAYYATTPPVPRAVQSVELTEKSALFSSATQVLLRVIVHFQDGGQHTAAVQCRGAQVLVDWEHWVHYQPMPVAAFLAGDPLPPGAAPEFRLSARHAEIFRSSPHFDQQTHRCLLLRDPPANGDEFPAYVRRGSVADQMLTAQLPTRAETAVILELQRHPSPSGIQEGGVEIVAWVADSWCKRLW